jgi:acyl-CoA thioester hydrolase
MKDRKLNKREKLSGTELPITYRGVVHPWQCDLMGHMNVVQYVSKFDDAAWQFLSMLGVDVTYFKKHHCGVAALEQHITYKAELHAGCTVTIRSGIIDTTEKVFRIRHEMRNNATEEISAVMILTIVHFDTHKRKSRPFPKSIRARAEEFRIIG